MSGAFCAGACVDTDVDEAHCGGCGIMCEGASECVNGACKTCSTGCAVLHATVTDNSSSPFVRYSIQLSPPVNLAGATITARLYIASSVQPDIVQVHIDDTTDSSSTGIYAATPVSVSGWFEAKMSNIPFSNIDLLELWLQDFNTLGSTAVYVDSISISPALAGPWNFASSAAPLAYSLGEGVDLNAISGGLTWFHD
jgi:hypothetical protein